MSKSFTVTLTDAEELSLSYAAASPAAWIDNAVHERARIAMDEIINIAVKRFLDLGQTIPGSRDEIVQAAFDNGWVIAAADINTTI